MFRDNDRMSLKTFARKVRKRYNMEPSRYKLGRARQSALAVVHGDEIKQFSLLWKYGKELVTRNPRSSFYVHLEHGLFSTCYMSLAACKIGWLKGCRPVICLDGTFIKTKYGGQLLTAVGIDGNDAIYPIAMAVVETECYSSWTWFLATLKQDLNIVNTAAFTIMSDKQKGLIKGVQEQFPDAEHRFCVRHLYQNINQVHKGETVRQQLWACAKSTTVATFERNMAKFAADNPGAHAFVEEMAPNTWCRAFFSDFPKCDILLNNTCEVFNRLILEARELPVLSMFEKIRAQIQHRQYTKKKEVEEKWSGTIAPKIRDKLRKNTEFSRDVEVSPATNRVFGVDSHGRNYVVELNLRSCTCRRWQLTGIPCSHAIACMRHDRIMPESMVSSCYSVATYMQAYGGHIFPLRDKEEWAAVDAMPILPPLFEKSAGRRRKNRRRQPEENEHGTRLSKHGAIMHCGFCKAAGHNRSGCKHLKAAIIRESQTVQEDNHAPQPTVHQQEHAPDVAQPPSVQTKGKGPAREVDDKNTSSRGRKRTQSFKMREHVEQLMEAARRKKSKKVIDENGDMDYPIIRTHINKKQVALDLDPEHQEDSMVHILSHEGAAQGVPLILEEMATESSFIAENRDNIPAARGPLVNTSGRALAATQGRSKRSNNKPSKRSKRYFRRKGSKRCYRTKRSKRRWKKCYKWSCQSYPMSSSNCC